MPSTDAPPPIPAVIDKAPPLAHAYRPPRRRTCLNGKLVYAKGAYSLGCTICNISEAGARVVISGPQLLPLDLYLIAIKYGVAYQSKVVWLSYPARGLKFSWAYQLDAILPEELTFLRHLWVDLSARSGAWP